MQNIKLQFSHVGGCGGQPIRSKSILKVKTQIPIPKEHAQITFLNPIDCFLSQITISNFPNCPGSPCNSSERHCKKVGGVRSLLVTFGRLPGRPVGRVPFWVGLCHANNSVKNDNCAGVLLSILFKR